MNIDVLISTMYRDDLKFLENLNLKDKKTIIINQIDKIKGANLTIDTDFTIMRSFYEKGLSKSRNKALGLSNSDVCVISDDDIEFVPEFHEKLIGLFKKHHTADVIIYDYETNSQSRKCNSLGVEGKILNKFDILKTSSVRISFKRDPIVNAGIRFNERFGAGAEFSAGEENLFLLDCLNSGLKIIYVPTIMCKVDFSDSTWFNGYDKKYFETKGAFSKVYFNGVLSHLYNFYFVLSKHKLYKNQMPFIKALNHIYNGYKAI
ncbi:glycosyltransferase [Sphingobacteriaceae bacterium WQ 2009]|uniref:Glycosyltransferase n=1 Tax=Rhinopithecimicrobium faecis TaxID=2820698 RepID=A0A8T4H5Q4_9SPHI|nr:glycosyltransferase [Sphingobacteriaceae bacterium WQ 2009]